MFRFFYFIKSIFNEILIILLLIFIINNFIGNVDKTINSDGVGYYDYLPSIFIHHDLVRYQTNQHLSPEKFKRINSLGVYLDYKDSKINRYLCGTAILESPFFLYTYYTAERSIELSDGYQTRFQHSIYFAALFYLFLTIFFLKKILQLYRCNYYTIIIMQLLLVLGTSVTDYVNFDAGFSHIYSLFAITAFIFFAKNYLEKRKYSDFLISCILLGLIILIRPVNGIIIFFIPFLAGSFRKLWEEIVFLVKNLGKTLLGIFIFSGVISLQCFLWYLQTGSIFINTYDDVGFNFLKPEWVNVLFSYRKGLFVYTPVLILAITALIWFAIKKRYHELLSWLAFFALVTYIISSWNCWFYGASFGLRAFIDFYTVFFILFAIMFDKLSLWLKIAYLIPAIFLVYVNIIQTYQYKVFLLHWSEMDKQKYWTVFLKTDEKLKGLVWKKKYTNELFNYQKTYEVLIGDLIIPSKTDSAIFRINSSQIKNFEKSAFFEISLDNDFQESSDARILMYIKEVNSNNVVYYNERYLLDFTEQGLNKNQIGLFNFELAPKLPEKEYELILSASSHSNRLELRNIKFSAFRRLND